jgi:replicative DNA helicase
MANPKRLKRNPLIKLIEQVDAQSPGDPAPDTVPTGFQSLDQILGGGFRLRDLIVLGGDVGSGKSALALGIALRVAQEGFPVAFISGEMDEDRVLERALAIEGRVQIDGIRNANLPDRQRAALGAVALDLQNLPLHVHPIVGPQFDEVLEPVWHHNPTLLVIDYLQLLSPPTTKLTQEEDNALTLRTLKAAALDRRVACLAVAQLPRHQLDRLDPRPTLDDFGVLGAVKQHADVVLGIYREEMYAPGGGNEGAAELIIAKNRNGPTGFVDLYFYQQWMRYEDMLDPDR